MEVIATAKHIGVTARKARIVSDAVVGMSVTEALTLLNFTPRHAAKEVAAVIQSAAANAENNYNLNGSSLRIARIDVDEAGMIKRYRAKSRGIAGNIKKRMSHLRAVVSDDEVEIPHRRRHLPTVPESLTSTPVARSTATSRHRHHHEDEELAADAEQAPEEDAEASKKTRRAKASKDDADKPKRQSKKEKEQ